MELLIYIRVLYLIINIKKLRVCNDAGRLTRPLLKVKNNKLLITSNIIKCQLQIMYYQWDDLFIDFKTDPNQLLNILIVMNKIIV